MKLLKVKKIDMTEQEIELRDLCDKAYLEDDAAMIEIYFKYRPEDGLNYFIKEWVAFNNGTFINSISQNKKRIAFLEKAKKAYQKLLDFKKKNNIPGKAMEM